jgi:enterobacteria phage integrase
VPRNRPPHIEIWSRDRHGKPRTWFRIKKGPRVPLPPLGSPGFNEAYAAAFASYPTVKKGKLPQAAPGSVEALIRSYYQSAEFLAVREATKKNYRVAMEAIRKEHGHRMVAGMTREAIVKFILQPYADRPGMRRLTLASLRVLVRHAIDIGMLQINPTLGIRSPKLKEVPAWSEDQMRPSFSAVPSSLPLLGCPCTSNCPIVNWTRVQATS